MDVTTNYLGLRLKNPLIAGASPMSREVGTVRAMEDAGIAAVVMYSLFEEQITHDSQTQDHFNSFGTDSFAESLSFLPSMDHYPRGPQEYIDHLALLKNAVDIPIIASLNGTTLGGWIEHAKLLEQAGADGIELNIYQLATDPTIDAKGVEDRYVDILKAVRETVSIPIAMKLSPFFSSLANFAKRLDDCGVDGLVLFNRFYQPDIDLENLEIVPNITLSAEHEMRLPLRWVAILDPLIDASLAATTGIYHPQDVIKLMMAGADATMLCASLLRGEPVVIQDMLRGIEHWMQEHEYESLHQMKGSMNHHTCSDPARFERANYIQALISYQ